MISSFLFMLVYATRLMPTPNDDSSFHEYVKMDTFENRN